MRQDKWQQQSVQGLTSANKEAVAFSLLGLASLLGVPSNLPSVTGARESAVLGHISVRQGSNLLQGRVHAVAQLGFEQNVDAYQRGRPEYPVKTVLRQTQLLRLNGDGLVLDLAAGSGKLTKGV